MLFRHRHLIWSLTVLDFKCRYAGTRLGLVWMLVAPLLLLGVYWLLFGRILRVQPESGLTGAEYGLMVAAGLLPWLGFSEGVTRGTGSVLAQRSLLKSKIFPMELIPVVSVFAGLASQLLGTALLLILLGLRGTLGPNVVLLPVILLLQAFFSIGLVWVLSCVNILYRDTSQVVGLLIVLLMFVSPIAYMPAMVPASLELLIKLNPLSYLIEAYRDALLSNHLPNLIGIAALACLSVLTLLCGYRYFMRLRRVLPDFV